MDLQLRGKVALVTASSKGMGRATALRFAQEGAAVAICARGREALDATAEEIRRTAGADVLAVAADIATPDGVERVVEQTLDRFGRIDALVCNSGGPPALHFSEAGEQDWREALDLTLQSAIRLVRAVLPAMRRQGGGAVVAITSTTVKEPSPGLVLSTVPRLGVVGLFRALARDHGPEGIRFNVVCPGGFRTDRAVELARREAEHSGRSVEELLAEKARSIPLRRLGNPDEIADVIVFLCSARAGYVTGSVISVDGGSTRALL